MIVSEGGAQVPAFVATKNEILQLVRCWETEIIDLDFAFFLSVIGIVRMAHSRICQSAPSIRSANPLVRKQGPRRSGWPSRLSADASVQRASKIFTEGTRKQEHFQQEVQERWHATPKGTNEQVDSDDCDPDRWVMSPKQLVISTTYKTRVAL